MAEQIAKESTTGIELTLTDSEGTLVNSSAISSIAYTWSDRLGVPVNGRNEVSALVANPVLIEITPEDSFFASTKVNHVSRRLTVKWVYTDAVLGVGTTFVHEYDLKIANNVNSFLA